MASTRAGPSDAAGDEPGSGIGPRQLAAIVVVPILVFGVSLLVASMLMKPSAPPLQEPRSAGQGVAAAQPTGGVLAASSPSPLVAASATPAQAAVPTATPVPAGTGPAGGPTPFQLVPSPVRAAGTFAQGSGGCRGFPASFNDQFMFSTSNGTVTLKQLSTGDVSSGPVQTDGSFAAKAADGSETYTGRITGLTATASYQHVDKAGCHQTYSTSFRFQV